MYVSDFTKFLDTFKSEHPDVAVDQAKGRSIWWDKRPQTDEEREHLAQSRVRQSGYVYQTKV